MARQVWTDICQGLDTFSVGCLQQPALTIDAEAACKGWDWLPCHVDLMIDAMHERQFSAR